MFLCRFPKLGSVDRTGFSIATSPSFLQIRPNLQEPVRGRTLPFLASLDIGKRKGFPRVPIWSGYPFLQVGAHVSWGLQKNTTDIGAPLFDVLLEPTCFSANHPHTPQTPSPSPPLRLLSRIMGAGGREGGGREPKFALKKALLRAL